VPDLPEPTLATSSHHRFWDGWVYERKLDGTDLRTEPLLERKRRLRQLLTWDGPIRYTPLPGSAHRQEREGRGA
jgi:ATP-dependent DNA ligase